MDGRFLLTEPLQDGSTAIDLQAQETVRLWAARKTVPDGVEVCGERWVSNTASEEAMLALMEPVEDLLGPQAFVCPPVRVAPEPLPRISRSFTWRPVLMAVMMLALVPIGLAATPPPPDYEGHRWVTEGYEAVAQRVEGNGGVQACLRGHRDRLRTRDAAYPALLTFEVSPTTAAQPFVEARSGDPVLVGCLLTVARRLKLPSGSYRMVLPVSDAQRSRVD